MPGGATGKCSNGSLIDRSTRASSDIAREFSGIEFGSLDIVSETPIDGRDLRPRDKVAVRESTGMEKSEKAQ